MKYCNVCELDVKPIAEESSLFKQIFDVSYSELICPHCRISLELSERGEMTEEEHKLLIEGLKRHKKEGTL